MSEKTSEKILEIIGANPEISARQIAEMLNLSPRGVEKQVDKLKQQGSLIRIGPDKGGYWAIVKE
jgi:ATP-dependent DNA helicase RecG